MQACCLVTLCFINILPWTFASVETRTISMRKTLAAKICPVFYGQLLEEHHEFTDKLWCLSKCRNTPLCRSCIFVERNSTCVLNTEILDNPTNFGCEWLVDYAEFTTNDKFQGEQYSVCLNDCTVIRNGLRLCNGGSSGGCDVTKGRLEVYHNSQWGTICDDEWRQHGVTNANVACKRFGFSSGSLLSQWMYGSGRGKIWLDNVVCTGREDSLDECRHNRWGTHNCDHHEDIGISCHD